MSTQNIDLLRRFLMAFNWDFSDFIMDTLHVSRDSADDQVVDILTELNTENA